MGFATAREGMGLCVGLELPTGLHMAGGTYSVAPGGAPVGEGHDPPGHLPEPRYPDQTHALPPQGFTGEANFPFPVWLLGVKLSIDNPPGPMIK